MFYYLPFYSSVTVKIQTYKMNECQRKQVLDKWGAPQERSNSEDSLRQNNEKNQEINDTVTDKLSRGSPLTELRRNGKPNSKSTLETQNANILVMGGCNGNNQNIIQLFLLNLKENKFEPLSIKLPHPRHSHGTVVLNNEIYVIGGISSKGKERGLLRFNQKMQPEQQSSMNHPRADIASKCVIFNGSILVFGGDKKNSVEEYNMEHNGWQEIASLNPKSVYWGAAVIKNEIYVVGNDGIEKYDPFTGIYEYVWETPELHGSISVLVHDTKIIVISGGKENWEFDVEDRNWGKLPSLSPSCSGFAATITGNGLIIITGGQHKNGSYHSVSYCNRSNWMPYPKKIFPQIHHSLTLITNSMVDEIFKQRNKSPPPRRTEQLTIPNSKVSNGQSVLIKSDSEYSNSEDTIAFINDPSMDIISDSSNSSFGIKTHMDGKAMKSTFPDAKTMNETKKCFCSYKYYDSTSWIDKQGSFDFPLKYSDEVIEIMLKKEQKIRYKKKNQIYLPNFKNPKGYCLIINNVEFIVNRLENRDGAHKDMKNISECFEKLGYETLKYTNLKRQEMLDTLSKFASRQDHGDSVIVVILTHGEEQQRLIGTDGELLSVYEILSEFNGNKASHLAEKPKLFFFQACRGENMDKGVETFIDGCLPSKKPKQNLLLPIESDFFVAYSSAFNYVALRNEDIGSWFIYIICEVFYKNAYEMDICDLMTLVNRRISGRIGFCNKQKVTQSSEFHSRLRKKFYFFPNLQNKLGQANSDKIEE